MLDFECASFGDFALSPGGLGEDIFAVVAGDDWLSMTEHNTGLIAATASYIHEIWVGGWDESLELVAILFSLELGVEEVSVHRLLKYYFNNILQPYFIFSPYTESQTSFF